MAWKTESKSVEAREVIGTANNDIEAFLGASAEFEEMGLRSKNDFCRLFVELDPAGKRYGFKILESMLKK